MKVLLDENIPKKLKTELSEYNVSTVQEMGWSGVQNGKLLDLLKEYNFDLLITADKNMKSQQNFKIYDVPVFVMNVTLLTYTHISALLPKLKEALDSDIKNGITLIQ